MSETKMCKACKTKPAKAGGPHCRDCEKVATDALDELFGGPGEIDKAIERAFNHGLGRDKYH